LPPWSPWRDMRMRAELRRASSSRCLPSNEYCDTQRISFDQQYDRVKIDPSKGESYVVAAADAEKTGFRRAMRHRGLAA
jgi:hypothetical protein